jgi:hypothetical protein
MNDLSPRSAPLAPYRAVSAWAVAGLGLAVLYTAWVLAAAAIAFRSHLPLLMNPATLVLPVIAALLSLIGWSEVRRSEGTRVGLRLAQVGLVLSVLAGAGYATYWQVTELALSQQARDFTRQWLEQVGRSSTDEVEACAAFWNTLDPARRDRSLDLNSVEVRQKLASDPKEFASLHEGLRRRYFWGDRGQKGPLPRFFDHELIQLVRQGGTHVEAEALGVRDWQFLSGTEGGYRLEQTFRLTTPEGVFEAVIPVLGKDLERRQWQVQIADAGIRQAKLSAFGGQMRDLRFDSRRFAIDWARKLAEGKVEEAFLDTLLPEQRQPLRDRPPEEVRSQPGYAAFAAGGLIDAQDLVAEPKKELPEMVREAKATFGLAALGKGSPLHVAPANAMLASGWRLDTKELRFYQPFEMQAGRYHIEGRLVVATLDEALLKKLREAEQAGPHSAEGPRLGRQASWRIVGVELEVASLLSK